MPFSLIAIAPLLFFYEYYIHEFNKEQVLQVRNAAEVTIKKSVALVGLYEPWHFALLYVAFTLAVLYAARQQNMSLLRIPYWGGVVFESLVYAALFGLVTKSITDFLLSLQMSMNITQTSLWPQLLLAIAAGIYEELLFRLLLVGSLLLIFRSLLDSKMLLQVLLASFVSAALFALFHYHSLEFVRWNSFLFRLVAGFILSLLYIYRGLAIAVYTHTFYDILFLYRKL